MNLNWANYLQIHIVYICVLILNGASATKDELKNEEILPVSCIPFGDSPGVHRIQLSGIDPFDVLCDSRTAGSGWLVIQQRLNGKVDFYRNWANYSEGFGTLDGEFFLGLEKIHRLISDQRHELHIHMERFDGTVNFAFYDNFVVAGTEDQYRLISLGEAFGNATNDRLKWHKNQKFTTFDRDNDSYNYGNCALERHGGWCNLNGPYFDHEVNETRSNYWDVWYSLKTIRMLIRPKVD